ncbi:MAG: hypothetical protein AAGB93_00670 [Planctomycetota bacterium]
MHETTLGSLPKNLLSLWRMGEPFSRFLMLFGFAILAVSIVLLAIADFTDVDLGEGKSLAVTGAVLSFALLMILSVYYESKIDLDRAQKIEAVELRVKENPHEPVAAWELARIKLESYLDRNLSQVRAIFWLTLLAMGVGFALIAYGVVRVYDGPETLGASVLVTSSGVVVEFVAGTFLLIYRSTISQARGYVSVLERINAVGMAVQILDSIEDEDGSVKLKATADLANKMLAMYSAPESDM